MLYIDTNILVYTMIDQGDDKTELSKQIINEAIKEGTLFISSLVLIELIFTLSKLKILNENNEAIKLYSNFCKSRVDKNVVFLAYEKCRKVDKCRNINDFVHLEIANRYCQRLVTFDSDFKNLQQYYSIDIEIVGN